MAERNSIDPNSSSRNPSNFYQHYEGQKPIGKGGYSKVFEAVEKLSRRKVAIKRVRLRSMNKDDVLSELKILAELEHTHMVRYYTSWSEPSEYHQEHDKILFQQPDVNISSGSFQDDDSTPAGNSAWEVRGRNSNTKNLSDSLAINKAMLLTDGILPSKEKVQKTSDHYEYLFIITELCNSQSLEHRLSPEYRSINKINRFDAFRIFYQIVEGVQYLHEIKKTVHCDLKPANILFSLNASDTVKIADFGLATMQKVFVPEDGVSFFKNQKYGTELYMMPDGEQTSLKRDIYALGIILFELLYPFSSDAERIMVLDELRKPRIKFPDDFETKNGNDILKSLISQLLSRSPEKRPTISNLKQLIQIHLRSEENDDGIVSKIEHILTNPSVKQLSLTTDDIQFGVFDTSDQYLLLSDDNKLKLYDISFKLINEFSGLHEYPQYVGFVKRIIWCECLRQFLILCQYFLYAFTPGVNAKLTDMQRIHYIDKYRENQDLRYITCTNKYAFINYSYRRIIQYNIPQWSHSREWSTAGLQYEDFDEIHRTTCSTTNDYIAFDVRLNKCKWVVDFRRIDDNLTFLKRIQQPDISVKQKLQLSGFEWLISSDKHHFCVVNSLEVESDLKIVETNVKSESDIYPRFFGNYFLVPIITNIQNNNSKIQRQGVIHFYNWK